METFSNLSEYSEYIWTILDLNLTCIALIYTTIFHLITYDMGMLSCMDIHNNLLCYSIYHDQNVPIEYMYFLLIH